MVSVRFQVGYLFEEKFIGKSSAKYAYSKWALLNINFLLIGPTYKKQ